MDYVQVSNKVHKGETEKQIEKEMPPDEKKAPENPKKKKKRKVTPSEKKGTRFIWQWEVFSLSSICLIISSYLVPQLIHHPLMLPAAWRQAILKRQKTKYTKNMQLHKIMKVSKICKSKDLGVLNDQIMLCSLFSSICCSSTVSLLLF